MKAIIIGATGLVGKEFVKKTLDLEAFDSVEVFVRRKTHLVHAKFKENIVNFDELDAWKMSIKGDVLFCAMGTTIKSAGSKEAQYKVDYEYQYNVAKAAKENGVNSLVLVSSSGADKKSPFYYLKMKGELEESLAKLGFPQFIILRPNLLEGEREENRAGEKISYAILSRLPKIRLFSRILPVSGHKVAQTGIEHVLKSITGRQIIEAVDILF